ncbi:MAG: hypothetical protein LBQ48_03255 [Oscillospiraceae bacterium]|jgi:hypothetical protein|nr:hypothetical protein [Oscillospiraceae bacterium]
MKHSNKHNRSFSFALAAAALITALSFPAAMAAENEISDTNPRLDILTIQSNAENIVDGQPLYTAESNFTQGDGNYHLETNAYVPWMSEDEVAFAYKQYNVKDTSDDFLEASLTVNHSPSSLPGKTPHEKASTGLMFRSGLEQDDAFVFLHVRANTVLAVYRTNKGGSATVQYSKVTVTYPLEIQMNKKGNSVQLYYRGAGTETWNRFQYAVGMKAAGPLYVGVAANSSSQENWVVGDFANLSVRGIGTWESGGGEEEPQKPPQEVVDDDPPLLTDMLLRETFSDGDFFNGTTDKIGNPVWNAGPENHEIVNINQNRFWFKNFNDSQDYLGNQKWTDYSVSLDMMFSKDCDPDPVAASNSVRLHARLTDVPMYGICDYYAMISEGYKITVAKRTFKDLKAETTGNTLGTATLRDFFDGPVVDGETTLYNVLGDGLVHRMRFDVFDNRLTVYWDGLKVLSVEDTPENAGASTAIGETVHGAGCVGVATVQTSVYLDNLTVRKLEDLFGGDYDNQIGGNWNDPVPSYVSQFKR